MIAVLFWGGASFVDKMALSGKLSPALGVSVRAMFVAALVLPYFIMQLVNGEAAKVAARSYGWVALSGLLASLLGQWALYSALKNDEVSRVVPLCSTYPIVAAVLGFAVRGEAITLPKMAGIVMVTGGIVLLTRG